MKNNSTFLVVLIIAVIFRSLASSQGTSADPLARATDLVNSDEIILVWSEGLSDILQYCNQRIYDLKLQGNLYQLEPKTKQTGAQIAGNKKMAIATGNFLGGSYKHPVVAWAGLNDSIHIIVPSIVGGTLSWTQVSRVSIAGALMPTNRSVNSKIHLAAGNFFGDNRDEFILVYQGPDTTIHLQIFSFNSGSLDPVPRGSINDERTLPGSTFLDNWDIASGDFNGDGIDEIVLVTVKPAPSNSWNMFAKVYSVNDQGNLIAKGSTNVFPKPAYTIFETNVVVATGDYDAHADDEIALGFCFFQGEQPGDDTYLYLLDIKDSLNTIVSSTSRRVTLNAVSVNNIEPLSIASGDLDGKGRDEIVFGVGSNVNIYASSDTLLPIFQHQRSGFFDAGDINRYSDHYLAVGDMDRDNKAEIVVVKNTYIRAPNELQRLNTYVYGILDTSLTVFQLKASRLNEEPIPSQNEGSIRHYAIAMGDFDGDRVRIGKAVHYRKSGVQQITVVVNSPPVHFDLFAGDTTKYDLSGCYPSQSCGFFSTYIQTSTAETTVTQELHSDWGVDASLGAGGSIFGVKIGAKIKGSYGEGFSRVVGSTKTYTISIGRLAAGDDWVYALVVDYDFYEYPVYDSLNTTPIGYVLAAIPGPARPLWIEAKDDAVIGNSFRPNHEVGNVLSYERTNSEDVDKLIVNMAEQTIGGTGSSFDQLEISDFIDNSVETTWEVGVEVSASAEFGIQVETSGKYTQKEVSTLKTHIGRSLTMRGDFGHLVTNFSTTGTYHVIPYAYWAKNGALVLDYKVPPFPVDPNSFWNTRYGGRYDLAFNLPWRLDPEKGLPLPGGDANYRQRTRDVTLSQKDPNPGDTVTVSARFRNFGLQDITSPVTVRFFKGDPDAGGEQIGEVVENNGIPARGTKKVSFTWTPPIGTPRTTRVYAVLDPGNSITNEIHENNNKGWTTLSDYAAPTDVADDPPVPSSFALYQAYPNPFNPSTTIRYELPAISHVILKVFNVLGQEIVTLKDELQAAGSREVQFNASGLPSGVYYYRLQTGDFAKTMKCVLLK